jgi:L-threonylcarbamoyladenylate synthase
MSNSPFLSNCTAKTIRDAAAALNAGYLVAFPTETVYGLGADARNLEAVKRIYEVKGRPTDHPLIVHISSINQLEKWAAEIPSYAISLARAFWPGPMTLILKRSEIVKDFITGGQKTVGLRVPRDPIALALIQEFEKISDSAIAAPSANRFGQVSPTSREDVQEELGDFLSEFDLILDGNASQVGIESTIIDCTGLLPKILRSGAVTRNQIAALLNVSVQTFSESEMKFSGMFKSHYAPASKVLIDAKPEIGAGFVALKDIETPPNVFRIDSPSTVEEYARNLYSNLRKADRLHLEKVVFVLPVGDGLVDAVRDRLTRASQGR